MFTFFSKKGVWVHKSSRQVASQSNWGCWAYGQGTLLRPECPPVPHPSLSAWPSVVVFVGSLLRVISHSHPLSLSLLPAETLCRRQSAPDSLTLAQHECNSNGGSRWRTGKVLLRRWSVQRVRLRRQGKGDSRRGRWLARSGRARQSAQSVSLRGERQEASFSEKAKPTH